MLNSFSMVPSLVDFKHAIAKSVDERLPYSYPFVLQNSVVSSKSLARSIKKSSETVPLPTSTFASQIVIPQPLRGLFTKLFVK